MGNWAEHLRKDKSRLVRITVDRADFVPWSVMIEQQQYPEQYVREMKASAKQLGQDHRSWWCRNKPLSLNSVLNVEIRMPSNGIRMPLLSTSLSTKPDLKHLPGSWQTVSPDVEFNHSLEVQICCLIVDGFGYASGRLIFGDNIKPAYSVYPIVRITDDPQVVEQQEAEAA
jgi:hypothetical protein